MTQTRPLRPGDIVEVRSPREILHTLDQDGTLDDLPFMPEMLEFSGKRFRVAQRILKTCISIGNSTNMREFQSSRIVTLDGLRCSGTDHDGCQKLCMIFWREEWLRTPEEGTPAPGIELEVRKQLRPRLKTTIDPETYFCQASQLFKVTTPLSRWGRFGKCFAEVRAGNCTAWEMTRRVSIWLFWRLRRKVFGIYASGPNKNTPAGTLNLQPGELVQVKPVEAIAKTLDHAAHNRGLYFTPDMSHFCGTEHRVARRLDKIVVDGTGKMRKLQNTVYLEGSHCGCSHVAFGGCSRGEFSYWREIWLRRSR